MFSLGKVVARIAEGLNNAINFIHPNLPHAQGYMTDLIKLIDLYEKNHLNIETEIEIKIFTKLIDLNFIKS